MDEYTRTCLESIKKSLEQISNLGYDGVETISDKLNLPLEDKTLIAFADLIDGICCTIDELSFQVESLLDGDPQDWDDPADWTLLDNVTDFDEDPTDEIESFYDLDPERLAREADEYDE